MTALAFLDLPPLRGAAGTVRLPGSKSISNRVLLLAAFSAGRTRVHDLLDSDDTAVMLDALRALGCGIARDGAALVVTGLGGRQEEGGAGRSAGRVGPPGRRPASPEQRARPRFRYRRGKPPPRFEVACP